MPRCSPLIRPTGSGSLPLCRRQRLRAAGDVRPGRALTAWLFRTSKASRGQKQGPSRIDVLVEAFPSDEFYLDYEKVQEAVDRKGQFNILHRSSGLKMDIFIPVMDAVDQSRFARAARVHPADDYEATFASAEGVIVKKLQIYAEGGSERHLRDIAGVLRVSSSDVDRDYVSRWAERPGLREDWDLILDQL